MRLTTETVRGISALVLIAAVVAQFVISIWHGDQGLETTPLVFAYLALAGAVANIGARTVEWRRRRGGRH